MKKRFLEQLMPLPITSNQLVIMGAIATIKEMDCFIINEVHEKVVWDSLFFLEHLSWGPMMKENLIWVCNEEIRKIRELYNEK